MLHLGRGGGQVVSVLTFDSDGPSSNLCINVVEKNGNGKKEIGVS